MTVNKRIKKLRSVLNLTQSDFGNALGLTKSRISAYEKDESIPDRILKSICSVYNVDYFWLTEGTGEMFNPTLPLIDQLAKEYKLSDTYKSIIQNLVLLSNREKEIVENIILNIANDIEKGEK